MTFAPAHVKAFHMSWRKEQRRAERGYHHGNLKEALLQAALGLIAKRARPDSPLPMPRGWPASARRRPTGIFATATNCCPASRNAASSSSRRC